MLLFWRLIKLRLMNTLIDQIVFPPRGSSSCHIKLFSMLGPPPLTNREKIRKTYKIEESTLTVHRADAESAELDRQRKSYIYCTPFCCEL